MADSLPKASHKVDDHPLKYAFAMEKDLAHTLGWLLLNTTRQG